MADKSTYWANAVINALRGTNITGLTNAWVSLHTADPGLTGSQEVTGGSYARQIVTLSAAASGATSNTAAVTFTSMPSATITHAGLFDSNTAGNFLYGDALTNGSQNVNAGGTFEFAIGDFDITES